MIKKINFTAAFLLACALGQAQVTEWAGKFGGDGEDVVLGVYADAQGYTYTTGYFSNNCDFDLGDPDYILSTGIPFQTFVQKNDPDGNLVWAKSIGGEGGDNGTKITTDALGNVYITGVFEGEGDFDPGDGEFILTSAGDLDIFIVKLNGNGELVWAKNFSGTDYEESNGIGVDDNGNIYVSGYFYDPVDFDPGNGEYEMSTAGSGDGFIVKLKNDGSFMWAKSFGGPGFDLATALKVTPDGDLYIAGNFTETADLDPGAGEFNVSVTGDEGGAYLLHLDSNGDFVKGVNAGVSVSAVYAVGVDVDSEGSAYITGYFGGDTTFITPAGNLVMSPTEFYNSYIAKISSDGFITWASQLQSNMLSLSYSVAVNSLDEVFVSGYFNGTLTLGEHSITEDNPGDSQNFIAKLDKNGNFISAQRFGGINFIDRCAIAIDGDDNIYVASAFDGTVDINPDVDNETIVTVTDFRDSFLVKMSNEILSAPDNPIVASLALYPNPTANYINITSREPLSGQSFTVCDMAGRQVLTGVIGPEQQISIAALQTGIYNIMIGSSAYRIIKK